MPENIFRYFPSLSKIQIERISALEDIYREWNGKINVISRKDFGNFYIHHVLHSLAIARIFSFLPGTRILDVGTGGGFPGIPLAILYPDSHFTLLDSIAKKIMVAEAAALRLGLGNVEAVRRRAEDEKGKYDFVVGRAVTEFPAFVKMTARNVAPSGVNRIRNGIICLKGGDIESETAPFKDRIEIYEISDFFCEPWFETKKIIYLPVCC